MYVCDAQRSNQQDLQCVRKVLLGFKREFGGKQLRERTMMCVFALKGFEEERLRGFACCQLGQLQTLRPAGSHVLPVAAA